MLRLALEIPTSMLERWTPLTDLDFILAHKVLQDTKYAEHFLNRPPGRELILDNSTHEFATKDPLTGKYTAGQPLSLSLLEKASKMCRADYLIAPDVVNEEIDVAQYRRNKLWALAAITAFRREGSSTKIATVLCGHTEETRNDYLAEIVSDMLCFTFHDSRRLEWWEDFVDNEEAFLRYERIHILGVSTLDEMQRWYQISEDNPSMNFSIDTTKAVKWGAQGKKIDTLQSLRGGPIDARAVLELEHFTDEQIECVEYNIMVLKKICSGLV